KTEANLLQMVTYSVTREQAPEEFAGALDLSLNTLVKVAGRENPHTARRIVYRLTLDQPRASLKFPSGATQQSEQIDELNYRVTVTRLDPQDRPDAVIAIAADEKYYSSSRHLELEHPAVIRLAEEGAGERTD